MLGKYLVSSPEEDEEGGLGWPTPRFPVLLQPFPPPFLIFLAAGPPPRRVTQASAIRLLPGWGKQAAALP